MDGVGEVARIAREGDGRRVTLAVPAPLRRFVAEKGSIAVDGVSLTVARVVTEGCEIAYIPHTLAVTLAGGYESGTRVNLEVDVIARYLARLAGSARPIGRHAMRTPSKTHGASGGRAAARVARRTPGASC